MHIRYQFEFKDGQQKCFDIQLDPSTLAVIPMELSEKPAWTELSYNQCSNCPLGEDVQYCPVALNLSSFVRIFEDSASYEEAHVTVTTKERTYSKQTTLQKGLSGMLGIYMVTSNCPIMDQLRPMVRFHLPFATPIESVYRTISMYLVGQLLVNKERREADWSLEGLRDMYKDIALVNKGMSKRIAAASRKDANINALVILSSLGDSVPYVVDSGLEDLKPIFDVYLRGNSYDDEANHWSRL